MPTITRPRLRVLAPLLLIALAGCSKRSSDYTMMSPSAAGAVASDRAAPLEVGDESYAHLAENPFKRVADDALSTFSIDVDTASYSNIRRFIEDGTLPPADAVRIEEMINYFAYGYAEPAGPEPFAVQTEVASCPWNPQARLVQIGIKGKSIAPAAVPPRMLAHSDFNNDRKDAGEIGAGHTVTALYEILPPGAEGSAPGVDPLKYQKPATVAAGSDELMHVKLRFKPPTGDTSQLLSFPVQDGETSIDAASVDLRFAAAVALFGMKLRGSEHAKQYDYTAAHRLAATALGSDPNGHRRGMLALVERAARLAGEPVTASVVAR